tara:strand:- start:1167 stop:1910 length:744 start_codon:yes stop_codon:yes gene_type:complete
MDKQFSISNWRNTVVNKESYQQLNEGDLFSSSMSREDLKDIIRDLDQAPIMDMAVRRAYKFLRSLLDKEDQEGLDSRELPSNIAQAEKDQIEKDARKFRGDIRENMYIDDEEFEMEMGRSKKDSLKKEMMIHVDQLIDGNIDMNDFMNVVEDIMAEVNSLKEDDEPSKKDIESAAGDLEFEVPTSTDSSNDMRNIIVKKVEKIEKKKENNEDFSMDMLALKQYIKKDNVRKQVGASEIRNLVSSLIK